MVFSEVLKKHRFTSKPFSISSSVRIEYTEYTTMDDLLPLKRPPQSPWKTQADYSKYMFPSCTETNMMAFNKMCFLSEDTIVYMDFPRHTGI